MSKHIQISFALLVGSAFWLAASDARPYSWSSQEWCVSNCIPSYSIDLQSFTTRGFEQSVVDQIVDGASIWNDMGTDLCISYANSTTGSCYGDNTICARNLDEQSKCRDAIAYNVLTYSLDFDCGFFELGNTHYYQVYCADAGWGMNAHESHIYNDFMLVSGHEFGHAMSLGDYPGPSGPNALMSYFYAPIIHYDDNTGLVNRYGYRNQNIKTRLAYGVSNGIIGTFLTTQTLSGLVTSVRPSISGNWTHWWGLGDNWDYAIAWVYAGKVYVGTARDNEDGTIQILNNTTYISSSNTKSPPSIAAGPPGHIIVTWKQGGTSNYIGIARIGISTAGQFTTVQTEFLSPYQPISNPVISYMWPYSRYIMTWVMDGTTFGFNNKHRIAVMVSTDEYGSSWNAPYTYPGTDPNYPEFVSSPWLEPAFTCHSPVFWDDKCLMMYKQFSTPETRYINQQGFQISSDRTRMNTIPTVFTTWDATQSPIFAVAGATEWIYTMVQYTGGYGYMQYRVKPESQGVAGDYKYYPTRTQYDMASRVGFPVAYNYRTNKYRFMWITH